MSIDTALLQLQQAANDHHNRFMQCNALVGVLKAVKGASDEPMPVVELAKMLLPFGLCIVHKDVMTNMLFILEGLNDDEGLSMDELRHLVDSMNAALEAR